MKGIKLKINSFRCSRIHDVYNNRILQVLFSMQQISLHTFPDDGTTWSADAFLDRIDETCRQASMVCVRRMNVLKICRVLLI